MTVPDIRTPTPEETAAARMVLARAEKRLTAMVARRGIDAEVIRTAAVYERLYAHATRPHGVAPRDDVMALVVATAVRRPGDVPEVVVLPRMFGETR